MLDPNSLRLAIALADIRGEMDFHASLGYWLRDAPELTDDWVRSLQPHTSPRTISEEHEILEVADCQAALTAPHGCVVHVYGHLSACITVKGHCEVVVAGDVLPRGSIHGDGIVRIYIGGSMHGEIINNGSSRVWVRGNLSGKVGTGKPSTQLHVLGDCLGTIGPASKPSLLYLEVCGFMPFASVQRTGAVGYTEFNAVVHRSDCPAGFYPDRAARQQLADHHSYNRWVVLASEHRGQSVLQGAVTG
jgi:hypothetical protein